tara:strand:- start:2436 stop:3368 length:933 start_codon:yes stop_codon:yes gene_type:complete
MSLVPVLPDSERRDWIRLARTQNIGPVTFAQLLKRFGSPAAALDALPEIARRAGRGRPIVVPTIDEIDAEIEATQRFGARIVASCEADFPPLLRTLAPPPPILTLLGRAPLAAQPTVAIVGARNASAAGRKLARDIAAGLGEAGFVTVSGLALGIDGEAHAATLRTGTIAVLGGAIDHIYPPQHERLYAEVAAEGLIISESPFGYRAKAQDFPRRNRIITGLSRGVVVVEAAERSGSLISARCRHKCPYLSRRFIGAPCDGRAGNSLFAQPRAGLGAAGRRLRSRIARRTPAGKPDRPRPRGPLAPPHAH